MRACWNAIRTVASASRRSHLYFNEAMHALTEFPPLRP